MNIQIETQPLKDATDNKHIEPNQFTNKSYLLYFT